MSEADGQPGILGAEEEQAQCVLDRLNHHRRCNGGGSGER